MYILTCAHLYMKISILVYTLSNKYMYSHIYMYTDEDLEIYGTHKYMHNSWRWPTNMYVYISFTAQMFRYLTRSHGGRGRMMARLGGHRRAGDRRAHTTRRPRRPQHRTAGWKERQKDQVRESETEKRRKRGDRNKHAHTHTHTHARCKLACKCVHDTVLTCPGGGCCPTWGRLRRRW